MGTQIHFGHRLETLAETLAARLAEERAPATPFTPSTVIVPNSNTKRWLQLQISRHDGIAANIQFPPLYQGLWELIEDVIDEPGMWPKPCQLRPDKMRLLILALVQQNAHGDGPLAQDLAPLTFLLYDADGNPRRNFASRLWMIAGQLGQYLEAYEYERPDMIDCWLRGELGNRQSASDPEVAKLDRCQMAIYRTIFGPNGLRDAIASITGERYMTLPQFSNLICRNTRRPIELPIVHLFGLSQMSIFHRDLLFQLSRFADIHIYQLNVCSEFWEDVTTEREDRWLRMRDHQPQVSEAGEEELGWDDDENMLLKWWGKPGRETVRLLSELENLAVDEMNLEVDWIEADSEGVPGNVLQHIQSQVLRRTQLPPDERVGQDRSLQIFAAPGIFREVETIHESIQENLAEDPTLMQTDIAILAPDINRYKPVINDIFSRKPKPLGYNLTESRASRDSVYAHAVTLLLELADGAFSRRQVFELIFNPCFLAGAGITREDALVWARWADNLQIFHSFDAQDKDARGYSANHLYTWQQGLQRLRLGRIMHMPPAEDSQAEPSHYQGLTPYVDIASADAELVGKFSLAVETLFRRIQRLAATTMKYADWADEFEATLDQYLAIPEDRAEEHAVRRRLFEVIKEQSLLDAMHTAAEWNDGVSFELAAEMVKSSLDDIASRHGSFLSGGVNVLEIRADRILPFKVVYIAGLREGEFPGAPEFSTLDLRRPGRRIGDVSPPERGRYCILEAIMSTRSRLYLSYVSKDLQKDQVFYPCSIIIQLQSCLERSVLADQFKIQHVPASGASLRYSLDDAGATFSDVMTTRNRTDQVLRVQSALAHDDVEIPDGDRVKLEKWLAEVTAKTAPAVLPAPESASLRANCKHTLRLTHLRRFLENPIESSLQFHLGLYEYDADTSDSTLLEDEPFFSQQALRNAILDRVISNMIRSDTPLLAANNSPLVDMVEQVYEDFRRRSLTPDGVFSCADRQNLVEDIRSRVFGSNVRRRIADVLRDMSGCEFIDRVAIGEPDGAGTVGLAFPALTLRNGRDEDVEIHGTLPFIWRDPARDGCNVLWLTHDSAYQKDFPVPRQLLTPYLFYITCLAHGSLACSEFIGTDVFTIYWSNRQGMRHYRYHFKRERARDYLTSLVESFFDADAFDLLPYEVASKINSTSELPVPMRPGSNANDREKGQYRRRLEHEINQEIDNPFSQWYHSRLLTITKRVVPDDAWDKIKQRLSPLHETH